MKNIIILNLGSSKDVIESSYLISSILEEHVDYNIEMLVDIKDIAIAQLIKGVKKIHTINSEKIIQIIETPLYSEAFAINEFVESIEAITSTSWDYAYNYSNDNVSSYLISAIDARQKVGTYISESGVARTTNKWATYQNAVASKHTRNVIDRINMRNHIAGTPVYHEAERIKLNSDYTSVASQNFSRIRQMKGSTATSIIGINLSEGYDDYALNEDVYTELLEAIEESENFKAVLLLDGKKYQRDIVNSLNQKFNNALISINVETEALPAVLSNIDVLVSTSNTQLAIADAMDTRCIEVRDYNAKTFSPVSHTDNNTIILVKDDTQTANDILIAINEELHSELPITSLQSTNPTYKLVQDDYGVFTTQVRGELHIEDELKYHLERSVTLENLGYPHNSEFIQHIRANSDQADLRDYLGNVKEELTETVKLLLATLRSLKGMKNSENGLNTFITYLDSLINAGQRDSLVGSSVRHFEGRIENIEAQDMDSNIKTIETNLFQLKAELQTITTLMSELTKPVTDQTNTDHVTEANA